jgi:hypothetical protein
MSPLKILLIALYVLIMSLVPLGVVYATAGILGGLAILALIAWGLVPLRKLKAQKDNSMWPAFMLQTPIIATSLIVSDPLLLFPTGILLAVLAVRYARGLI